MLCDADPPMTVGPIALEYVLPFVSVTDCTAAVPSFQPMTTTLRLPAACPAVNVTATDVNADCGVAAFTCTNEMAGGACVAALAVPEYGPTFAAASVARTR